MKLIYVCHPYGGKPENVELCKGIVMKLQDKHPQDVFISGISAIPGDYCKVEYSVGLARCLELLSRCDVIIPTGEWKNSKGCLAEVAFAIKSGIEIKEEE